jgi:hypothetical protein
VPLTAFQRTILRLLAGNRSPNSYLAGGAALHFKPNSHRFCKHLDFFHDSEERAASTFDVDAGLLRASGFAVDVELSQPGHIRALISRGDDSTRIDWAHDSAWRFLPPVQDEEGGYLLLPLGPLCWAAAGKDSGFTPHSLVELLKRRGRPRQEELDRLNLVEPLNVVSTKERWLRALAEAEAFVDQRPAGKLGCLYYSTARDAIVAPEPDTPLADQGIVEHYGAPGGVLPQPSDIPPAPS